MSSTANKKRESPFPVKKPLGPKKSTKLQKTSSTSSTTSSDSELDGNDWDKFNVDKWRSAMFETEAYFEDLYPEQTRFTERIIKELAGTRKVKLIEVGCGTGDYLRAMLETKTVKKLKDNVTAIGMDYNKLFIEWCIKHQKEKSGKTNKPIEWLTGDATQLGALLKEHDVQVSPGEFPIVACVGNTLGIIHGETRQKVYEEMKRVIGARGVMFLTYWDGDCFGDAVQHFYGKNPQLCGTLDGSEIDWKNTTLQTKSGYKTKWTSEDDAKRIMKDLGLEIRFIQARSKGVLVCASNPQTNAENGFSTDETATQEYYDSEDAFNFYTNVWGGENIHIGLYNDWYKTQPNNKGKFDPKNYEKHENGKNIVAEASVKSVEKLASLVPKNLASKENLKIMDMGSALGGCSRFFAKQFKNSQILGIDLSKKECEMNERLTKEQNMQDQVKIKCASFTNTGEASDSYDLILSEDSFLHAGAYRAGAVKEASRLLKKGGQFIFSDIMQIDTNNIEQLKKDLASIYNRIALSDMGSPEFYKKVGKENGLKFVKFEDHTEELINHYSMVKNVLQTKREEFIEKKIVSNGYITHMIQGLDHWISGGKAGNLVYGFFVFEK